MTKYLLVFLTAASVLAVLPGAAAALPSQAAPQAFAHACDAPAGLACVEFIHPEAGPPQPAVSSVCTVTGNDQVSTYGLGGWHMTGPLTYRVNYATAPASVGVNAAQQAFVASFGTWSSADPDKTFVEGASTGVKVSKFDGINAVLWGSVQYSSAIAVTRVWYYTSTGALAEADVVFNKRLPWKANDPAAGDCGGDVSSYDVQNIATHEFGHVFGLGDLYGDAEKDLTMYGYGTKGELKKVSLGLGDALGANALVP